MVLKYIQVNTECETRDLALNKYKHIKKLLCKQIQAADNPYLSLQFKYPQVTITTKNELPGNLGPDMRTLHHGSSDRLT